MPNRGHGQRKQINAQFDRLLIWPPLRCELSGRGCAGTQALAVCLATSLAVRAAERAAPPGTPARTSPKSCGGMVVPAIPAAHLILVQPHLALGECKALLDASTLSPHPRQRPTRGPGRREDDVVGQSRWIAAAAPQQQPVASASLLRREVQTRFQFQPGGEERRSRDNVA